MTNDDLVTLLRDIAHKLDNNPAERLQDIIEPLRAVTTPDVGIDRGAEMDHTDEGFNLQLRWYGGQLLSMADAGQLFGINSWINCIDKFTTRRPAP
jgi:hypothetical protein